VEAVEEGDQIVVFAGIALGGSDLEVKAVGEALFRGCGAGQVDRFGVVVEAEELRGRVGLGHEDGGGTETAADVGNFAAALELAGDAVEGGDPGGGEVGEVARAEEALGSVEEIMVMLVPAHAGAGAEGVFDAVGVVEAGGDDLEGTGDEGGALLHGEGECLFGGKGVGGGGGVVGDVAAGGVGVEPFADVALAGARAAGELGGADGTPSTMAL